MNLMKNQLFVNRVMAFMMPSMMHCNEWHYSPDHLGRLSSD